MALAGSIIKIRLLPKFDVFKGFTQKQLVNGPSVNKIVQSRFLRQCRKYSTNATVHPADKTLTSICKKEKISHSSSSSSSSDSEFDENGRLKRCLFPDSCKVYYQFADVSVEYYNGLPQITVPLPSRRERCKFTLKPITNNVGDFITMLKTEDKGIDRVVALSTDDTRIAASNSIETLLQEDFKLVINDHTYIVRTPQQNRITGEEAKRLDDIKTIVSQLYEALNVQEFNVSKEKDLIGQLEVLRQELMPLEEEYVLKDVKDRQQLLTIHKKAKKAGLDLTRYNNLKEEISELERAIYKLQHPLKLHLPNKADPTKTSTEPKPTQ